MKTIASLIVTCCLAVALLAPTAFACDEAKTAGGSACSGEAKAVLASEGGGCHETLAQVVAALTAAMKSCDDECPGQAHLKVAMSSLKKLGGGQPVAVAKLVSTGEGESSQCSSAAKATLATAGGSTCSSGGQAATLASAGEKTCEATKQVVQVSSSQCSSVAKAALAKAGGSTCSSGGQAATLASASEKTCEATEQVVQVSSSQCDSAAKAALAKAGGGDCCPSGQAATLVSAGGTTCDGTKQAVQVSSSQCSSAKEASFVAFGCTKTDRVARAAAKAYLQVMAELKQMTGADTCAMETATQVLATLAKEMQAARLAATQATPAAAAQVSLGGVSDGDRSGCGEECAAECCAR